VVKNSFKVENDFKIVNPGLIYTYENLLLVGEKNKGIHILDNSNPSNPTGLKFIHLLGNENISVMNDIVYLDNGIDLVYIDISDLSNVQFAGRVEGVFPERDRGNGNLYAGYNTRIVKRKIPCPQSSNNSMARGPSTANNAPAFSPSVTAGNMPSGTAGSMSKFAILGNYLYITTANKLRPFDLSNAKNPLAKPTIGLSSNFVETIFPYNNSLYFGTSDGVLVYDCSGSPESPVYKKRLTHVMGCDPVVVKDDFAFSTIRSGTTCRSNVATGLLNIYNVGFSGGNNPISTISLVEPYGLGVDKSIVVVCQGEHGLFLYDWNKPSTLTLRHSYPDIKAYDVIMKDNILIVTANNGLFQFDYSNPDAVKYLSTLFEN
jgi:hypothetical protein